MTEEARGRVNGGLVIVGVAIMVLSFFVALAKEVGATQIDCAEVRNCTVESGSETFTESLEHKEWIVAIDKPLINPVLVHKSKKQQQHCTAADEYDKLLGSVLSGQGDGYYLDQDGYTIWSADRKDRITKCRPADFSKTDHIAKAGASQLSGYWRIWNELVERTTEWTRIVCTITPRYHSPVPEPSAMLLFGAGVVGVAGLARRKK